ncbi:MAG: glycine cleavage system protein GcvH [Dehalococcoidia bacterium]|nr:glycine cleavage system protein GcvH [Dehalococcoidia bacterium]
MVILPNLRYTKEHEWVLVEDGIGTVGITDYAQDQLGDIVYVALPAPGKRLSQLAVFGEIESVKAVSELYSPVSGEVVESNGALADKPELVNDSPYGEGWIMKVRLADEGEIEKLLTAAQYSDYIEREAE